MDENGVYSTRYAKHRWSASYVTYYCMWFRLFATALVPLTSLIYCNAKILIYYRENNFTKAYTAMRKLNQNTGASASELNEPLKGTTTAAGTCTMTDGNIQQADKVHSVQATRNNIEEAH